MSISKQEDGKSNRKGGKTDSSTETRAKNRPKRTSVRRRRLLEAKHRPGYVRRWVNEELGAIEDYMAAGWEPVAGEEDASDPRLQNNSNLGSVIRRVVNRDPNANAKYAVLMELPEDEFQARQAEQLREVDRIDEALDPRKRKQGGADYGSLKKS